MACWAVLEPGEFAPVGHEWTQAAPAPAGEGFYCEALGFGDDNLLRVHPKHLSEGWEQDLIAAWLAYRGGGIGTGPLPDAGGWLEQVALTLEAFDICFWVDGKLRASKQKHQD